MKPQFAFDEKTAGRMGVYPLAAEATTAEHAVKAAIRVRDEVVQGLRALDQSAQSLNLDASRLAGSAWTLTIVAAAALSSSIATSSHPSR